MTTKTKPINNPKTEVHIRWIIRRDMPEVLDIESRLNPYPWEEDDFIRHLRQRNTIGMVAEKHDEVIGFLIYELHKNHIDVLKLAVDPDRRKESIGSQLSRKIIGKLTPQRRRRALITLRKSNLSGQLFLKSCGWFATKFLQGWYDDSGEDGYVMEHWFQG